jgi:general secretion pathway protein F
MSLSKLDWFPNMVLQFVRVGEQSGRMGQMLEEVAGLVEQDFETRTEKTLEIISPLLTLIMGGIVALLVASVLLGIMSINDVSL